MDTALIKNRDYFLVLPFSRNSWKLMSPLPSETWPHPAVGSYTAASSLKVGTHFKWRENISDMPLFHEFLHSFPVPSGLQEYCLQVSFTKAIAEVVRSNQLVYRSKQHVHANNLLSPGAFFQQVVCNEPSLEFVCSWCKY